MIHRLQPLAHSPPLPPPLQASTDPAQAIAAGFFFTPPNSRSARSNPHPARALLVSLLTVLTLHRKISADAGRLPARMSFFVTAFDGFFISCGWSQRKREPEYCRVYRSIADRPSKKPQAVCAGALVGVSFGVGFYFSADFQRGKHPAIMGVCCSKGTSAGL